MTLDDRTAAGTALMQEAADLVRRGYADPDLVVSSKAPGDLVSATDFAVERHLRAAIGARFPNDRIIGEELGGAGAGAGFAWLIDPVDGTVNFARKLGYFCVSLALLEAGRPVAAWVLDPLQNELFHAGPDRVARLNGSPMQCSSETDMREAVIGLGFSSRHGSDLPPRLVAAVMAAEAEFRRLGAGALCLAHVAAGRLEAYLEPHMNPWDAVGGLYLAACAGAVTGDYVGLGGIEQGGVVYAAAPAISENLLARLPAPFSGTPLSSGNEPRSAGMTASSSQTPKLNVETRQ